jgi:predicted AAA+ superfamily ATPase
LVPQILGRIREIHPKIQVILGPRQVGKTTAIRQALEELESTDAVFETADSPTPLSAYRIQEWWAQALDRRSRILVIDEIQKIPGWAEEIKRLWDREPLKLVLSGSAAFALEKNLRESLAGRYELIRAEHWNFAEARALFQTSLREFVELGCYPGAMEYRADLPRWGSYIRDSIVEPVIGRDLLQLHPIDHPALLRQLFGLCTSLPAQIVSIHKLQGHLQDRGAIATLQHYLDLLGQSFLVSGVQKFSTQAIRTRRSSPKIIVHDNALLRAFERPIESVLTPERFGRYFENAIGARLIEAGWDVYYWSERDLEVDFVVHSPSGEKWAIEVKSAKFGAKDLAGIKKFCGLHPEFVPKLIALEPPAEFENALGIGRLSPEEILSMARK